MTGADSGSVLRELAVATVRQRWASFSGSFVALALGAAILATSTVTLAATDGDGLSKAQSVAQVTTALSLMVVVFVLAGTFAFVVDQRARELALLSLLGLTPARIMRLILTETVLVGAAAAATGCLLGLPGAYLLRRWLVANEIAPAPYPVGLPLAALVIAFFVSTGAALAGSSAAAWRASRARPLDALRDASASARVMTPTRWVFGVLFLVGGAVVALVLAATDPANAASPGVFFPVPVLCAVGLSLLAPALGRPLARVTTLPLTRRGAVGLVVSQGVLNGGRRMAALVSPVVLAVGMFAGMLSMEGTSRAATAELYADGVSADLVAAPKIEDRFDASALQALRSHEGVDVATVAPEWLLLEKRRGGRVVRVEGRAVPLPVLGDVITPRLVSGSLDELSSRDVVVSADLASTLGVAAGDTLTVRLDGADRKSMVELRVAAVVRTVIGEGAAYVSDSLAGVGSPSQAFVRLQAGVSRSVVENSLRGSDVDVVPFSSFVAAETADEARSTRLANVVFLGIAVLYALLAIANTMIMNGSARRREMTILSLTGATDRTLRQVLVGEALLIVGIGTVVAVLGAALGQVLQRLALARDDISPALAVPWLPTATVVLVCCAVAVGAVLLTMADLDRDRTSGSSS